MKSFSILLSRSSNPAALQSLAQVSLFTVSFFLDSILTSRLVLDVRDAAAVESWIQTTVKEHGKLDGAANLAGVLGPTIGVTGIEDIPLSEFDFIIDVNLKGVFHCLRAELKAMNEKIKGGDQKLGSIVNAASIAGMVGMAKNPAYTASKHAVIGLTRAAAKECGGGGVRVNAIAP